MQKYISIDGKGGSGKTYLSNALAERLKTPIYHLDEYGNDYEPFVGIPALCDILRNAQGELIIYEGVGVFDKRLDEFNAFRILVAVPDEIRAARATGRDVPTDERSADDWKRIYDIWAVAEKHYFTDEILQKADLVVGNDGNFDLDLICSKLKNCKLI